AFVELLGVEADGAHYVLAVGFLVAVEQVAQGWAAVAGHPGRDVFHCQPDGLFGLENQGWPARFGGADCHQECHRGLLWVFQASGEADDGLCSHDCLLSGCPPGWTAAGGRGPAAVTGTKPEHSMRSQVILPSVRSRNACCSTVKLPLALVTRNR